MLNNYCTLEIKWNGNTGVSFGKICGMLYHHFFLLGELNYILIKTFVAESETKHSGDKASGEGKFPAKLFLTPCILYFLFILLCWKIETRLNATFYC